MKKIERRKRRQAKLIGIEQIMLLQSNNPLLDGIKQQIIARISKVNERRES